MVKPIIMYLILVHTIMLSLLLGTNIVQVKLINEQEIQGEFIGIYMNHIHILKDEQLYYYACDKILFISSPKKNFSYDCSKNTVTANVLFPPEIDPMTGNWVQRIPDLFNPSITQPIVIKEVDDIDKDRMTTNVDEDESRLNDKVSVSERLETADEDFIMINGVKYIKSETNGIMDQHGGLNNINQRIPDKKLADSEIISIALEDARQNHSEGTWSCLGLGTSLFGWLVGGGMTDEFSEEHAFWGGLGLALPYLAASRYDASIPYYPSEIKTVSKKELYKATYVLETRRLRKVSVMVLPLISLMGLFSFF